MQFVRYLLFPFSILYGCITWVRNKLFDWGLKKEHEIFFPSIGVGNLSVGGTGKTPHVILLNKMLSEEGDITIVSRGYGRKTKGLVWADESSTAETIGDEPLLFLNSTPRPTVIVSEKRVNAIQKIEVAGKNTIILLDDVFQHRHVKPGLNILLCDYNKPYFKDFMLPTGNLREFRAGEKRADIVIVTKCPSDLTEDKKGAFSNNICLNSKNIFFSSITYSGFEKFSEIEKPQEIKNVILVTGIANPKPLEEHLLVNYSLKSVIFPDHHEFTDKDITRIHEIFGNFASENSVILTTEKDAMRLEKFKTKGVLNDFPWFVQKMDVKIDRQKELKDKIVDYVRKVQ